MHAIRAPPPAPIPVLVQSHSFTRLNLPLAGNRFFFSFLSLQAVFRCLTRSLPLTHMAVSEPASVSLLSPPLPLAAVLADQLIFPIEPSLAQWSLSSSGAKAEIKSAR